MAADGAWVQLSRGPYLAGQGRARQGREGQGWLHPVQTINSRTIYHGHTTFFIPRIDC